MDSTLKKSKTLRFGKCNREDGLSCLPDELICQILSLLPTKDAAVASLSSKKMRSAFTQLTALDFDDSPISYCARNNPLFVDDFQLFKTFVSNVLQASQSPHLSRFRIGFGGDFNIIQLHIREPSRVCGSTCFPHVESTILNSWIAFPLNHSGIREIDLRIHVRNPGKLPSALFACQTLEVLKLNTNLDFELVSSMSSFSLPNLKVLQLRSILIPEDDFVSRLVSSCPSLVELYMRCWWKYGNSVTISSPSLRKLTLIFNRDEEYLDLCNIDTPNLQCFKYRDLLGLHYSIPSMKVLVQASFHVWDILHTQRESLDSVLRLVTAVSNVQRLTLANSIVEVLDCEESKNLLPVFHNLRHLKLGHDGTTKWDRVLLEILKSSPLLETLGFPKGCDSGPIFCLDGSSYEDSNLELDLERQFFRKNHEPPPCCKSFLKRIYIKKCWGLEQEVEFVSFLLKIALVLEELLIICEEHDWVDKPSFESRLKKLPKASSTCLIIVH
ncbi:F-box/LRR-repeat protein At3g59190-like [Silene latifolia]|uniref:F-box/LRR-repeat protein At3g59190-like n=1 Tax=Silene latifolia TaxID=37657 RepID=UPI003D76E586